MNLRITISSDLSKLKLSKEVLKQAMQRGLLKAGYVLERDAKMNAPVDTGRLRDSIQTTQQGDKVIVQDNVTYGVYNEYGTVKMKAHPFMRPAIETNLENIKQIIIEEIRKELR